MKRGVSSIEYLFLIAVALVIVLFVIHQLVVMTSDYTDVMETISTEIAQELANQSCNGTSKIVIYYVHYDAKGNDNYPWNLNDEYIVIANLGCKDEELSGWKLVDEKKHTYTFPSGVIVKAGKTVTVHTGSGTDTDTDLYWGSSWGAVWDNDGDTAYLYDASENLVDSCSWTGKEGGAVSCH
ncbi:competence-like protein [Thermococcus onnurineus NA1]|uniref:Competence-like protein n=1 Tax=Thermococcus onnurineus (strain NA1) TaxID=523850 RepID=B6YU61_THEON|nr:lamin tail domain-containing protein [Thermococcus onnurineus]ACJ16003.1 competence-like protein [Thermococcus onnurineus NA1]